MHTIWPNITFVHYTVYSIHHITISTEIYCQTFKCFWCTGGHGVVYEERWGLEWWSTPYIPVTTTSTRCHLSYGRITPPVGHRKVSKYSARSASCSVQVKLLQKKVTPNISCQLGLEVSSYNWQRRLLQKGRAHKLVETHVSP